MKYRTFRSTTATAVLAIALAISLRSHGQQTQAEASLNKGALDLEKLLQLLVDVPTWPEGDSEYGTNGWLHLLRVARYVETCDPTSVESALKTYESAYDFRQRVPTHRSLADFDIDRDSEVIRQDSKLFLLMRVIFEIPEKDRGAKFYPWRTACEDTPGTALSWPVTWVDGSPHLICGSTGIQGPVNLYSPSREYRYFREHYRTRDLSAVKNFGSDRKQIAQLKPRHGAVQPQVRRAPPTGLRRKRP